MNKRSIAKRLLSKILILSAVFTMFYTCLNIFLDYSSKKSSLLVTVNSLISSSQSSITKAVWNFDEEIVEAQVKSLLEHRDIISVNVKNSGDDFFNHEKENIGIYKATEFIKTPLNFVDANGKKVDVGTIDVKITKDFIQDEVLASFTTLMIFQTIKTFIVSLGILYILNRFLISHVKAITDYFVSNSHITDENKEPRMLDIRSSKKGKDEIDILVSAVNDAINTSYKFIKEQNEKSKLQSSLEAAEVVQESLLPHENIKIPGVQIVTSYVPADNTGGDWYYYFYDEKSKMAYFFCGDVTGHGIPSALVTAVCCGCALCVQKLFEKSNELPIHVLQETILTTIGESLNHSIISTGSSCDRLMTMLVASLNIETGEMTVLNAGHNHPFWYSKKSERIKTIACSGNRLGFKENPTFRLKTFHLMPGDRVFLFTDGLVENVGPSGEFLSEKKLKDFLMQSKDKELEDIHSEVFAKVKNMWKENPADDDVTTLFIQWDGPVEGKLEKAA